MTENELLEQFNVSICEFSSNEWPRNGFIDPINRVVYINGDLDQDTRLKVILHELGHLEHNPKHYERLREKYEAVFPAHAGVILMVFHHLHKEHCFSCTRGSDPTDANFDSIFKMFFLHMQG